MRVLILLSIVALVLSESTTKEKEKKKRTTTNTVYVPSGYNQPHVVAVIGQPVPPPPAPTHQSYYPAPQYNIIRVVYPFNDHQRVGTAHHPVQYAPNHVQHVPYVSHQPQEYVQVVPVVVNPHVVPQGYQPQVPKPHSYVGNHLYVNPEYNVVRTVPVNPVLFYGNYGSGNIGKAVPSPGYQNIVVQALPTAQPHVSYDINMKHAVQSPAENVIAPYSLFVHLKAPGHKYTNIPLQDTVKFSSTPRVINSHVPSYPSPFQVQGAPKDHIPASYYHSPIYTTAVLSNTTPSPKTFPRDSSNSYRKDTGLKPPSPSAIPPLKNGVVDQKGNSVDKLNYNSYDH